MGFVHYASGCIVGPFIEYIDFKNWIELKGHYKDLPRGNFATVWPAFKRFCAGCLCVTFHLTVTVYFGYSVYFCGKPEYIHYKTFFHRVFFYILAMTSQRFMYYTPWCYSDSALIACGLAFNKVEKGKKQDWKYISNINIAALELGTSVVNMASNWYHSIHMCLKNHV